MCACVCVCVRVCVRVWCVRVCLPLHQSCTLHECLRRHTHPRTLAPRTREHFCRSGFSPKLTLWSRRCSAVTTRCVLCACVRACARARVCVCVVSGGWVVVGVVGLCVRVRCVVVVPLRVDGHTSACAYLCVCMSTRKRRIEKF